MARTLIYLLRRDLRLADNPVFAELAKFSSQSQSPFTHLLPLYVFPAQQIEVSGFIPAAASGSPCPYPEARSEVGKFPRCGHHRAAFIAESVWDLKKNLEAVGSGLEIRVGMMGEVVEKLLQEWREGDVHGVWMTGEEGVEEKREERDVERAVRRAGKEFKLWRDEKYFVDECVCCSLLAPERDDLHTDNSIAAAIYRSRTLSNYLTSSPAFETR